MAGCAWGMTKSFAARHNKGTSAMAAIPPPGIHESSRPHRDMMVDYRMRRPACGALPGALQLECLFLHVLALQRAAGGRPVVKPALLDVDQAPRQVARRPGRAPGQSTCASAPQSDPAIWVHAVSVGEVLAVSELVKKLGGASPNTESWFRPPRPRARSWQSNILERTASSISRWILDSRFDRISRRCGPG